MKGPLRLRVSLAIVLLTAAVCGAGSETSAGKSEPASRGWCAFMDALGRPIQQAEVSIFRLNEEYDKVLVCRMTTDDEGMLSDPQAGTSRSRCFFVVSHSGYGTAIAKMAPYEGVDRSPYSYVPVVARDSRDYAQCARGVIRDSDGNPVVGARITGRGVTAPGGIWIYGLVGSYTVLSDSDGRFALYVPLQTTLGTFKVPAHSEYLVIIEPPGESGLAFWSGEISNDQACTIVLAEADHFRTFTFEDANGAITDPGMLGMIWLRLRVPHYSRWQIGYPDFKHGLTLPPAKVEALMYRSEPPFTGRLYEFDPVEITDDGPGQIVFKAKEKPPVKTIMYTGRVVDAATDMPMAAAFVAYADFSEGDVSGLTTSHWKNLHTLDQEPSLDDPGLKPFLRLLSSSCVVRTDRNGEFRFSVPNTLKREFILAVEQGFLSIPVYVRGKAEYAPDPNNIVKLPVIRMYPAATVRLTPVTAGEPAVRIRATWELPDNAGPAWFGDFAQAFRSTSQFHGSKYLQSNEQGGMHIPAQVNVRLRLQVVPSLSWDRRFWLPLLTEPINLRQGQRADLGRIEFKSPKAVYVQVINSAGKPVAGVAVRHKDVSQRPHLRYDQLCITDEEGIAEFQVAFRHEATFFVDCRAPRSVRKTESVTYDIKGPEDANTIYTLELSDEICKALFE